MPSEPLLEQLAAGAAGLKIHEDWGATPAIIDAALKAAEIGGGQIHLHADTLNESGFVEAHSARHGRTVHSRLSRRGAPGVGTRQTSSACAAYRMYCPHLRTLRIHSPSTRLMNISDMAMTSHHLNPRLPEDVAFAESRIRKRNHWRRRRSARHGSDQRDRFRQPGDGAHR